MSSFHEKIFNAVSDMAAVANNPFKDKWVSIIGDSISTYEGYIPEGNKTWYPYNDVDDVSKTWWHLLLTKLGAKLCVNESWSGRWAVGSGDSSTKQVVDAVNKLERVKGNTYVNLDGSTEEATENIQPDIILCLIGINDFKNGATLGEFSNAIVKDMTTDFYSAYNNLCLHLIGHHPRAQVYCLEITYTTEIGFLGSNSKGDKYLDYNTAINKEAELYGVNVIHTSKLGVSGSNGSTFLIDGIHPNATGMKRIANQCYNEMMANNFM